MHTIVDDVGHAGVPIIHGFHVIGSKKVGDTVRILNTPKLFNLKWIADTDEKRRYTRGKDVKDCYAIHIC